MADKDKATALNVDPTKTAQWMRVKDLSGLSAVQIAMLNNLEVLALQQQKIMQRLDLLLEAMDRPVEEEDSTTTASSVLKDEEEPVAVDKAV